MIKVLLQLLFTSSLLLVSAQKTCSAETESVDVTQVHLPEAKVWRGRALPLTLSPYVFTLTYLLNKVDVHTLHI